MDSQVLTYSLVPTYGNRDPKTNSPIHTTSSPLSTTGLRTSHKSTALGLPVQNGSVRPRFGPDARQVSGSVPTWLLLAKLLRAFVAERLMRSLSAVPRHRSSQTLGLNKTQKSRQIPKESGGFQSRGEMI